MSTSLGICKFNNNTGVTCYINSILSILQQTPYFADFIISDQYSVKDEDDVENSVIFQLFKIFKISMSNDNKGLTINKFRQIISQKNPMWAEFQHQDSQEFLTFLLNSIDDDINYNVDFIPGRKMDKVKLNINNLIALNYWKKFTRREYSFIKQLFTGQNQSKIKCSKCNFINNSFEIFQNLQLNIEETNNNIYNCLDSYIKAERLDRDNMIYCNFCFCKNRALKSNMIWKPPKVLIINFKRFKYNNFGLLQAKNNKFIKYPIKNLNIKQYISPDSPHINNYNYNLFGVNIHKSLGLDNSINFGHYISCVKNRFDNKWYIFDDSNVRKADYNDIVNKDAYLLFYLRKDN